MTRIGRTRRHPDARPGTGARGRPAGPPETSPVLPRGGGAATSAPPSGQRDPHGARGRPPRWSPRRHGPAVLAPLAFPGGASRWAGASATRGAALQPLPPAPRTVPQLPARHGGVWGSAVASRAHGTVASQTLWAHAQISAGQQPTVPTATGPASLCSKPQNAR